MIVVYTAILNDWDYLRPPIVIEPGVRYICFADRPLPPVTPWEIQPAYTPYGVGSRNSRLPKILPHLHFAAAYSIWHDANFTLNVRPTAVIGTYLRDHDIAMYRHPCRNHVGEECEVLLREKIGDPGEVERARTLWKHAGAPVGLWAGGLILRRHATEVQALNEEWWRLFRTGCTRDQISLPVAQCTTGIDINSIPGDIYASELMGFHWHAAWRDKPDNQKYQTEAKVYECRRRRLEELAV